MTKSQQISFDEYLNITLDNNHINLFYQTQLNNRLINLENRNFLQSTFIPQVPVFNIKKYDLSQLERQESKRQKNIIKNLLINNQQVDHENDVVYVEKNPLTSLNRKNLQIQSKITVKIATNFINENKEKKVNFKQPNTDIVFMPKLEVFTHEEIEDQQIMSEQEILDSVPDLSGMILENVKGFQY